MIFLSSFSQCFIALLFYLARCGCTCITIRDIHLVNREIYIILTLQTIRKDYKNIHIMMVKLIIMKRRKKKKKKKH